METSGILYILWLPKSYVKNSKISLIISPLLVLMDNQMDSASRMNLNVRTINFINKNELEDIIQEVNDDKVDALIISPERLANGEFN